MHLTKSITAISLGALVIATAGFAAGHSDKAAAAAVGARHAQMQLIAYHTGILGGMAKGEAEYDAEKAKVAASNLHAAATLDTSTMWIEGPILMRLRLAWAISAKPVALATTITAYPRANPCDAF